MPPPLDLTGRRFGKLLVLGPQGKVKFGKIQAAWLCRCDCGIEVVYPQNRLPHRESIDPSHRVDACPACRARPCAVCGTPILPPSTAATCSDDCRILHHRETDLRHYYKKAAEDPEFNVRRHRRAKQRRAEDPALQRRHLETSRQAKERRREKLADDPDALENRRQRARLHYAANAEAIQAKRKARLDAMSPEELARWLDRVRRYSRNYAAQRRDGMHKDQAAHQAYLDLMREYRRRRGLQALANIGAKLKELMDDE